MAKLDRDELLRLGEALLDQWAVPPDADVAGLRQHCLREPAADLAIATRLGARAEEGSVALLEEIAAGCKDKQVRKEVKRSLYRLQQRGVTVPAAPAAPAAAIASAVEGSLSAVDGRGDQLVWLVKAVPGGVLHLFAVVNDPEGMRDVGLSRTTRKTLRSAQRELEAKHEIQLVGADGRHCDFLMNRAFLWAQQRGTRMEGDYPGLRSQLFRTVAPTDLPPLIFSRIEPAAIRARPELLAESESLWEEREFRTWVLAGDTLAPYIEELHRMKESPIVLSQAQQQERMRVTVERAVEELFSGEWQVSWARRLTMMAYYFSASGRDLQARRACAVALALQESTRGGRDIPFCEQLVRGSLAAYWEVEQQREQERAKTSLIMTPQEAAQAARRRP